MPPSEARTAQQRCRLSPLSRQHQTAAVHYTIQAQRLRFSSLLLLEQRDHLVLPCLFCEGKRRHSVACCEEVRSVRAPHASSSCTALVAPAWLAYMSAVAPASSGSVFWMSGSARRCRSSRMHSRQPAAGGALNESSSSPMHAHVRGLAPLCCTRSTLAPARRSAATA